MSKDYLLCHPFYVAKLFKCVLSTQLEWIKKYAMVAPSIFQLPTALLPNICEDEVHMKQVSMTLKSDMI